MNIEQEVREVLIEQLGIDSKDITLDSNIKNDLGADSLDVVEITFALEDIFNLEIEDDEMEKIETIKDIIVLIEKKEKEK